MGSTFERKYGVALVAGTTSIDIPIIKRAAVDFAVGADWTPAAGDVVIRKDNAAAANITNLPTAIAAGNSAFWRFMLTGPELEGKNIKVVISDAATKAVEDQMFIIETFGSVLAMIPGDKSTGFVIAEVAAIDEGAITADSLATDAIEKIQDGLSRPGVQQLIIKPSDIASQEYLAAVAVSVDFIGENMALQSSLEGKLNKATFVDSMNKVVTARTAQGNPSTYEVGTGDNKTEVSVTYATIEGVEKVSEESI